VAVPAKITSAVPWKAMAEMPYFPTTLPSTVLTPGIVSNSVPGRAPFGLKVVSGRPLEEVSRARGISVVLAVDDPVTRIVPLGWTTAAFAWSEEEAEKETVANGVKDTLRPGGFNS
jgi:hypothetical protein